MSTHNVCVLDVKNIFLTLLCRALAIVNMLSSLELLFQEMEEQLDLKTTTVATQELHKPSME